MLKYSLKGVSLLIRWTSSEQCADRTGWTYTNNFSNVSVNNRHVNTCTKSEEQSFRRASTFDITGCVVLKIKKTLSLSLIRFTVWGGARSWEKCFYCAIDVRRRTLDTMIASDKVCSPGSTAVRVRVKWHGLDFPLRGHDEARDPFCLWIMNCIWRKIRTPPLYAARLQSGEGTAQPAVLRTFCC